jgi:hypothetical protein
MSKCPKCGVRVNFFSDLCPDCERENKSKESQKDQLDCHRKLLDQQNKDKKALFQEQHKKEKALLQERQEQEVADHVRCVISEILDDEENDSTIEQLVAVFTSYPDMTSRILSQIYSNPFRRHLCGKVLFNYGSWENLFDLQSQDKELMEGMISEAETYGRLDWLQKIAEEKRKIAKEEQKIVERKIAKQKQKRDKTASCLMRFILIIVAIYAILSLLFLMLDKILFWVSEKISG